MIEDDLPWDRLTADGQTVVEGDPVSHGGKPAAIICLHDPCSKNRLSGDRPLGAHPPLPCHRPMLTSTVARTSH